MKQKLLFVVMSLVLSLATWAQNEDMLNTPLTLEAIETGIITFNNEAAGSVTYRVNNSYVKNIESKTIGTIVLCKGDQVAFFGDNDNYMLDYQTYSNIMCSANCYIYGNIMSLVSSSDYATADKLEGKFTFSKLFRENNYLKNHPSHQLILPATTLAIRCYSGMFERCTGLTEAPKLPATTLAEGCYSGMFSGCTCLTKAPDLPATTLAEWCYSGMFNGCTGLTKAPELPATTLVERCYSIMFSGCTGLTKAPALPATTLARDCYNGMFSGCTGLTKAPELPATTLASSCYELMFKRCTGLTKAPELPATKLASYCYYGLFNGCTGLTEAPKLPATTLASSCYHGMFNGCTGLTKAPELPATTLAGWCYKEMFYGCTGLTEAPELPATKLVNDCYYEMFRDCTNLNSVTCLATDISATNATKNWLDGVSATGTFYKHPNMKDWPTDENGIPEGWMVVDYDMTGISATTFGSKKAAIITYDLRGMKAANKKGLKIIDRKKIVVR